MNREKDPKEGKSKLLRCAAISGGLGFALTMLLLFLVAVLTVSGVIPANMKDEYVICSVIIGAIISGARCAKVMGSGVITAGLAAAGACLIFVLAGSIFTVKPAGNEALTLKIIIASLAGGCFGGATRLYRKTKKSKIRKRI